MEGVDGEDLVGFGGFGRRESSACFADRRVGLGLVRCYASESGRAHWTLDSATGWITEGFGGGPAG